MAPARSGSHIALLDDDDDDDFEVDDVISPRAAGYAAPETTMQTEERDKLSEVRRRPAKRITSDY